MPLKLQMIFCAKGVQSISDLIKNPGIVNLDFADINSVMKDAGYAHMGVGRASGEDKARQAAERAISSPLWKHPSAVLWVLSLTSHLLLILAWKKLQLLLK